MRFKACNALIIAIIAPDAGGFGIGLRLSMVGAVAIAAASRKHTHTRGHTDSSEGGCCGHV